MNVTFTSGIGIINEGYIHCKRWKLIIEGPLLCCSETCRNESMFFALSVWTKWKLQNMRKACCSLMSQDYKSCTKYHSTISTFYKSVYSEHKSGKAAHANYRPKRFCLVLVAQEGFAWWGNTLTTALLHDLNRAIPFGTIVHWRTLLTSFTLILKSTVPWWKFIPWRRTNGVPVVSGSGTSSFVTKYLVYNWVFLAVKRFSVSKRHYM